MMGGRGAAAEKISLNEYLGKRGLSLPISDYMLDKERNPHSLTHIAYFDISIFIDNGTLTDRIIIRHIAFG